MAEEQEWITVYDLINQFGRDDLPTDEVADENGDIEEVLALEYINDAIKSARLLIQRHLRKAGVDLPASDSIKSEMRESLFNITRYFYSERDGNMTESIKEMYESTIENLKDISAGKVELTEKSKNTGLKRVRLFRI